MKNENEENLNVKNSPETTTTEPKKKKWRKTKICLSIMGIIFAVLLAALIICPGFIIENSLPTVASALLKTKVEVESVNINVFAGSIRINELKVHNYPQYKSPYALELGHMCIDIGMMSLFSDKIEIEEVTIERFAASLEFRNLVGDSNLSDIAASLKQGEEKAIEKKAEKKKETPEEVRKEEKKMVIRKLRFADSNITFQNIPILLPSVELTDVGDGRPISDFFVVIMDTTVELVLNACKGISDAAGAALENINSGAAQIVDGANQVIDNANQVIDNANQIIDGVKNIFKRK